jgi:hypothetical protein
MIRVAVLNLVAALGLTGGVRAGIYTTDPSIAQVTGPLTLEQFFFLHDIYTQAAIPRPVVGQKDPHQHFLALIDELEKKEKQPLGLSIDERINLSAYYLRTQQPEKAVQVLLPVAKEQNFMVLANLATAYHLSGRLERTVDYQEMALKAWPSTWPGMYQSQLSWFYRVERYYLALLRSRFAEERLQPGKPPETLDDLFPGVRFVGPSGQYEAGRIDALQYARLPADHVAVVEQLLLWLPLDPRLTWMFGELLNANNNSKNARVILDNLIWTRNYSPPMLKEHVQILKEADRGMLVWEEKMAPNLDYLSLLWAVSPRGAVAPGESAAANEIGFAAALHLREVQLEELRRRKQQASEDSATTPTASKGETKTPWLPDLRHVIVSFVAGVVLTLLAGMQVREIRRRREADAAKS